MYPIMLNLEHKPCLVVGGGGVALRKVEGLLAEQACVTVIAPSPIHALDQFGREGQIQLVNRTYQSPEAKNYQLVFAATDNRQVNQQIYNDAQAAGVWVNVADDPPRCSFHLPARIQRGAFQLAIASAGEAPFVVRRLRRFLEQKIGPEWEEWAQAAARFRKQVRALNIDNKEQERLYDKFFNESVEAQKLNTRIPTQSEIESWYKDSEKSLTQSIKDSVISSEDTSSQHAGFVSLVGAGPGDPGLLTIRGYERLMQADVVVYDRLAAPALPAYLPTRTILRCVGKEAGHHPMPQEEINALLLRLGKRSKQVVRLKGGDPFVFGRGGEEAEALLNAGIPFEVIPCVTAGIAVAAYGGIPVTHRGQVVSLTLMTAHESTKGEGPQVRYDLLARNPHNTIIGYMGVTRLADVTKKLIEAGMDPQTPAAMIERGTTAQQRKVLSTVSNLSLKAIEADLQPPAIFIIGSTVSHAAQFSWYDTKALFGQRIGMFQPNKTIKNELLRQGVELCDVPNPLQPASLVVLKSLALSGWIIRDESELEILETERDALPFTANATLWCLKKNCSIYAEERGWMRVCVLPGEDQLKQWTKTMRDFLDLGIP